MAINIESVLDAFASETVHDRNTFERYIRKYPELAEELIDIAAEFRLSSEIAETEESVIDDRKLTTDWENFVAARQKQSVATLDPFEQHKGVAFAALAQELNVSRSLLVAVRDRLVVPSTVPAGFVCRLAKATSTSVESVRTYLAQGSRMPSGLAFKSNQKPAQQGQVVFRQLVENSELSESQRQVLLRECEQHEFD